MNLRFPLYGKILLWFFLNLLLLAGAFYVVARVQFRFGLDSLLAGRADDRVQAVADVIAAELKEKPRAEWPGVMKRFSEAYQLSFHLLRNDGVPLAGEDVVLPPEVSVKLVDRRQLPPARPFRADSPPGEPKGPPQGNLREENLRPEAPAGRLQNGPHPKFMVRTENPRLYWVGVRMPPMGRQMPMPLTLLIVSESVRGGGLFFDFTPWIVAGLGAVVCSVLFWIPLVRGITRAVSQMTEATGRIAEGEFEARVSARRNDELGLLATAINRLAARLAGFVGGQKRFLGDIAHELCAPLARIQLALGILEQRADEKQKAYVEDLREEVQHMSNLVNELLSFSKAGLRQREIRLESVELAVLARRVVAREVAGENRVKIEIAPEVQALAEPELLARALANLVRNALRYAGSAGLITLAARYSNVQVIITVADCGPGVPEDKLQQIFDPFFRLETSRSRDTGGVGLGLAIVKTCVEACQGSISARNRPPGGLEVEIVLRAAQP